jgi:tetratricopeptide (TPR) repeat protein
VGQYARLVRPQFHGGLVVNPQQNPRFPFLRHDLPGQRLPFDAVSLGLRWLRLPSVLLGVLTFMALRTGLRQLWPRDPLGRRLVLALALLAPNTLHIFATVANDALLLLLSTLALALALRVVCEPVPAAWLFLASGLCLGLGFWTKMTVFIPLAAVGSLWGFDLVANRRWHVYRRGALFFLPPLALLAGAYFIGNQVLYQSPTRERVLWLLTRAFYKDQASSVLWILGRLAVDLPRAFLADLGWQSVRMEAVSPLVFWGWLAAVVTAAWSCRAATAVSAPAAAPVAGPWRVANLLPALAVLWGLVFVVLANRHWTNTQVRHAWCVYPFTVLALPQVLGRLTRRRYRRWRRWLCLAGIALALGANAWVLWRFGEFYRPVADTRCNRDYQTMLYSRVLNPNRARGYLRFGDFLTADYLEAFEQHRWEEAAALSRQAAARGQWPVVATYVRAFSLYALGRQAEALQLVLPLKDRYPPAYPLYAQLLIDTGRRDEARQYIETVLPTCQPHEAVELRQQLSRLAAPGPTTPASGALAPPPTPQLPALRP